MEVVKLASNHSKLSGPDWQDLALAMEGFEMENNVRLTFVGAFCLTGGLSDLVWSLTAFPREVESGEVKTLASVSAKCRAQGFKTLGGLLFFLLYQLDFQLALGEFDSITKSG